MHDVIYYYCDWLYTSHVFLELVFFHVLFFLNSSGRPSLLENLPEFHSIIQDQKSSPELLSSPQTECTRDVLCEWSYRITLRIIIILRTRKAIIKLSIINDTPRFRVLRTGEGRRGGGEDRLFSSLPYSLVWQYAAYVWACFRVFRNKVLTRFPVRTGCSFFFFF